MIAKTVNYFWHHELSAMTWNYTIAHAFTIDRENVNYEDIRPLMHVPESPQTYNSNDFAETSATKKT